MAAHLERGFDVSERRAIKSNSCSELRRNLEREKGIIEHGPNHPLVRRVSCICGTARTHTTSALALGLHEAYLSVSEVK